MYISLGPRIGDCSLVGDLHWHLFVSGVQHASASPAWLCRRACPGLWGWQAHGTKASSTLPGHKAVAARRVHEKRAPGWGLKFLRVGAGLGIHLWVPSFECSGRRVVGFGPHVALCTLMPPLSETSLQDIAPDLQAPLCPPLCLFHGTLPEIRGNGYCVPGTVPGPAGVGWVLCKGHLMHSSPWPQDRYCDCPHGRRDSIIQTTVLLAHNAVCTPGISAQL